MEGEVGCGEDGEGEGEAEPEGLEADGGKGAVAGGEEGGVGGGGDVAGEVAGFGEAEVVAVSSGFGWCC